jgi:DNA-binding transcriptional ArsR family regulator
MPIPLTRLDFSFISEPKLIAARLRVAQVVALSIFVLLNHIVVVFTADRAAQVSFRYHEIMAHDFDESLGAEPRVLSSTTLELIFASNLVHSTDPSLAGFDDDWKRHQRENLSEDATQYLKFADEGLAWATLSLCDYLPISGLYEDWELFTAFVNAQPIDDFLSILLNKDIPLEEIPRLRRDPNRAAGWTDRLTCFSKMKPEAAVRIFSDPESFRIQLLSFIAANRTAAFSEKLEECRPRIKARVAAVRGLLKGKDPIVFAEELSSRPFHRARDFRSYAFVPSYFLGRKNIYSYGDRNFLLAFGLSMATEQAMAKAKELSDQMKVFGDRTRLDILRLLSEGPSYGKAIADRLELTTATVSRQLDQLKEAGFVIEDRADTNNVKLVHLKATAIAELFWQVQGFLGVEKP